MIIGRVSEEETFNPMNVPLKDRFTLNVPQAAALAGIPARVIRAAIIYADLEVCYAGSSTMRIRRKDRDDWVTSLPSEPQTM